MGASIICENRQRCAEKRNMDSYSNEDRLDVWPCNPFVNMLNNVSSWLSMKYSRDMWKGWSTDGLFSLNDQHFNKDMGRKEKQKSYTPVNDSYGFQTLQGAIYPVSQPFSCSATTLFSTVS